LLNGPAWQRPKGWADKLKVLDVNETTPGHLYLEPYPSVWFYDYTAPLLFKSVEGNFVVTTRIDVSGADGAMPSTTYSLAGLMARRPQLFKEATPFVSERNLNWDDYRISNEKLVALCPFLVE
jgi:hypothetical protein